MGGIMADVPSGRHPPPRIRHSGSRMFR